MQRSVSRRQRRQPPPPATGASVQRELALAAGAEQFAHRDPVYHVTEQFRQSFERAGLSRAAGLEEGSGFSPSDRVDGGEEKGAGGQAHGEREGAERPHTLPGTGVPVRRFAQMAFQRGNLSASILEGTGKVMLVSCLKYAVGQSDVTRLQQRTLFDVGSQRRNVPGRDPDQMLFNRNVAGSAVGLVVDALRDARRVVDSMAQMAGGTGELQADGGGATLKAMYPFLDDSRERELLAGYTAQLASCTDENQRPILHSALVRTRALMAKKSQMRLEFVNKLRLFSQRARQAMEELEAPGFVEDVAAAVWGPAEPALPPEPPEEGGAPNGAQPPDGAPEPGAPAGQPAAGGEERP